MKKRIQAYIFSLVMLLTMVNVNIFADSDRVSFSAVYEDGCISLIGFAGDKYAGKPVAIALKQDNNKNIPLYFNDTAINHDGNIYFEFPYELEKAADNYYLQISVTDKIRQIVEISVSETHMSNFEYYSSDGWQELTYDAYDSLKGSNAQIRVTVPETAEGTYFCAFAIKDANNTLSSFIFATSGAENTYSATLAIPNNGVVEAYYWNSAEYSPVCAKAVLPNDCLKKLEFNENAAMISENPGKGWVRMAMSNDGTYGIPSAAVLPYVSVGYTRFNWNQLEPEENKYNWTAIDNFINAWANVGKKAAFGIACASSVNQASYLTPKWVFDAGAASTTLVRAGMQDQYVPVWNDPVYLAKLEKFTRALAKRYDGRSSIAFIDIRSYGNFGETHVADLSPSISLTAEQEKAHIDIATKYFKKTQLIIPTTNSVDQGIKTAYAVSKNVGLRADSVMGGFYAEQHNLDAAYGKVPTAFELVNSYSYLKSNNLWDDANFIRAFYTGKPSYMDLGQYGDEAHTFITDKGNLIASLSNKMGYHFVCKNAELPLYIKNGKDFTVHMQWKNSGITRVYEECYVALALLDENNNAIDKIWLDSINPQSWGAGETVDCGGKGRFLNINNSVEKIAIGLFRNKSDATPSYKIGNYNLTGNKWFVIADATVSQDGVGIAQIAQPNSTSAPYDLDGFYNTNMAPFTVDPGNGNVISDSGLNRSVINWFPVKNYSTVLSGYSTAAPVGTYIGKIINRSIENSGAQIDVTDLLRAKGPGTYTLSGNFKSSINSRKANLCLRINSFDVIQQAELLSDSSYKTISGNVTITQDQLNKMTHAVVVIIGDNRSYVDNTYEIYFNNVTLTKN
ncbi:MAG: DUF4832 domain-containing protein [Firmicutes bacterium]|nr:DUF4832 domain-containing protein [Bacillota bacterium]